MSGRVAAAVCGLASALLALLVPLIGGLAEPGYSHSAQFISELGAEGAANATLVAFLGFAPTGALVLGFIVLSVRVLPNFRRVGMGLLGVAAVGTAYLVAAVFPCDAGCPAQGSATQSIHNLFGLLEYVGAMVGLLLLASALRSVPVWRSLAPLSFAAAVLVAVGLIAMLTPTLQPLRGISQRIAESAIFGWIAYTSWLFLRTACEDNPADKAQGGVA